MLIDAIPLINKDIQINMVGHFPKLQTMNTLKRLAYKLRYPSIFKLREKLIAISKYENVKFVGSVSTITNILQESSFLISPFTVPHFSRPVIEAFAYAKPVITSDVVGMDEIVDDDVNGLIIKNGDSKALAESINTLVNKPELLKEMGENGRRKAIEFYSPKINVLKIENIYNQLTSNRTQ